MPNKKKEEATIAKREAEHQAHIQRMESLLSKKALLWQKAETHLLRSIASAYDQVTQLLSDLKAIAEYEGQLLAFEEKLKKWLVQYQRRGAFMRRLQEKGMVE